MPEPPIEIKRKTKLQWWWFLLLPVLIIGVIVVQAVGPNPPIEVGRDTTYISEPLNEQGLPDYAQYLLKRSADGVTSENNAAVLLFEALGLEDIEARHQHHLVEALGMAWPAKVMEPPFSEKMRADVAAWASKINPNLDEETRERLSYDVIDLAMNRPWSPEDMPFVESWAERNAMPLRLLIEAASRPKYFVPPPNLIAGEDTMLFSLLLPDVSMMRSAARDLKLNAMYHVSRQEYAEAWENLLANYRLSRHCGRNPFLIHALVAVAMEEMAHNSLRALLSQDLSAELLQKMRDDLAALPPRKPMSEVYSDGERLGGLDVITSLAQGRHRDVANFDDSTGQLANVAGRIRLDWNVSLRAANAWYDRLSEACNLPYQERRHALEKIEEELTMLSPVSQPTRMLYSVVSTRARSELVSDVMLSLMFPATVAASKAEDRAKMHQNLIDIAIAVALHRTEHGEYPQTLDELVPAYFAEVPKDFYRDELPIYSRQDEGYVLYSVFENGIDDGGTHYDGEIVRGKYVDEEVEVSRDKTDHVIRIPVPRFRLPKNLSTIDQNGSEDADSLSSPQDENTGTNQG